MENLRNGMMIAEVIVVLLLVICILLQSGDEGGILGTGGGGESFRTKRGLEKFVYYATIALGVIFAVLSFMIVKVTQ